MRTGDKYTREDQTREKLQIEAKAKVDAPLREALTDPESGILRAGLLPQVNCASSAGAKQLLASITEALDLGDLGKELSTDKILSANQVATVSSCYCTWFSGLPTAVTFWKSIAHVFASLLPKHCVCSQRACLQICNPQDSIIIHEKGIKHVSHCSAHRWLQSRKLLQERGKRLKR